MTQEEIIKLAHTAGFNWPDIQATTIEQRLERFASLVAATEREKFTNTQEFVTLPREVVERALKVLEYAANDVLTGRNAATELRAALEQPDHSEQNLNMIPAGWKLVPDEPTCGMVLAGEHSMKQHDFFRLDAGYRAMLAAAPQPQTTEQSSAVEQPQVEQEPVAVVDFTTEGWRKIVDALRTLPDGAQLYTRPQNLQCKSTQARLATLWGYVKEQPKREPLTDEQIIRMVNQAGWDAVNLEDGFGERIRRYTEILEAAHNIK